MTVTVVALDAVVPIEGHLQQIATSCLRALSKHGLPSVGRHAGGGEEVLVAACRRAARQGLRLELE